MSRTTRRYLGGIGRDGHQDWRTSIARDNRATGLRTHKRDRRVARASLKSGNGDSLPGGKRRRYSDRYGAYELVAGRHATRADPGRGGTGGGARGRGGAGGEQQAAGARTGYWYNSGIQGEIVEMTGGSGSIPSWNANGLLPPYLGNPASNANRSPYPVSLADLVSQFGYTSARRQILSGFLDFRAALHSAGLMQGVQWVNGSFVEDVMQRRGREPDDIDVVTFYYPLNGHTQTTLQNEFPILFNTRDTKHLYHTDVLYMEPSAYDMPQMVRFITYLSNLWGHTRQTDEWKGYLQIDLSDTEDAEARDILRLANGDGDTP